MPHTLLDIDYSLPGIGLKPVPIQILGRLPELNNEIAG
jgi:hypothetical protein